MPITIAGWLTTKKVRLTMPSTDFAKAIELNPNDAAIAYQQSRGSLLQKRRL